MFFFLATTDHSSSTLSETTKRIDGGHSTIMIDQDTTGTTPDIGTSSTSVGTSAAGPFSGIPSTTTQQQQGSTTNSHRQTTPPFTSSTGAGTTWTSTTTTQHHETTTSEEHDQYTPTIQESDITHSVDDTEEPPIPDPEPPYPHPPLQQPPPYPPPQPRPPKGNNKGRISSEAEERTAMIIGIVAGAMIAVILVILLLLWLKSTGDRTYKNEHDKSGTYGGQGPNAALLGSNTGTNSSQLHHHHHHQQTNGATVPLNGSVRNGGGGAGAGDKGAQMNMNIGGNGSSGGGMGGPGTLQLQKPKKRDSKDIKEWYV